MTEVIRIERDADIAVIVIDNPPINAGSVAVRRGLLAAIETCGKPVVAALHGAALGDGKTLLRDRNVPVADDGEVAAATRDALKAGRNRPAIRAAVE